MRIVAVDIGTGTQDVLWFDTEREPENALKLVMPSPTVLVANAIRGATQAGEAILLTGVTMGGGPCSWAARDHLAAGHRIFATPDAARTLDDDLAEVAAMGVVVVSEDEARALAGVRPIRTLDLDYESLARVFRLFGIEIGAAELLTVGVFDHGAAPPGVSDRLFRFRYLAERIGSGRGLPAFAFPRDEIPPSMTRLQAAASSAPTEQPVLAMDTAPAAALGAREDPTVRERDQTVVVNIGNFHTLAFRLSCGAVTGLFEHHTGLLGRSRLEELLQRLAAGTLSHQEIFDEHGHGALLLDPMPRPLEFIAVTGPRRGLLAGSRLHPYPAVPYGDMMMAGCWGMVRAAAELLPWASEAICGRLGSG